MSGRRLHAVAVVAVLVVASLFYLLSPCVYAYFSEAGMVYAYVPKWFASSPPARITMRWFDRYNADAPRAARFGRQTSCFLFDEGASRKPGCTHEIRPGQAVRGPDVLRLASGQYVVRFDFSASEACSMGEARLEVVTTGRFGRVLAEYAGRLMPGERLELPFQLKTMDAALGAVEFRATGLRDCVLLEHVEWTERSASRQARGR
jgi:hypothetical protein